MKGEKVIVRAFGGEPVVCRVWEITPKVVSVCSEENYNTCMRGEKGLWPVGFHRENVFEYDEKISLEGWQNNPSFWLQLIKYADNE